MVKGKVELLKEEIENLQQQVAELENEALEPKIERAISDFCKSGLLEKDLFRGFDPRHPLVKNHLRAVIEWHENEQGDPPGELLYEYVCEITPDTGKEIDGNPFNRTLEIEDYLHSFL